MKHFTDALKALRVDEIFKKYTVLDRIDYYSNHFLGKPYVGGAQGEGPDGVYDQAPLYRFDCFDCVTYVNNILALSLSATEAEFIQNLLKINYYDAKPLFENRFHFMSCDWNVQNQQHHIVKDITETVRDANQQSVALKAVGEIDKPNWYRLQKKAVPPNAEIVSANITYLPLSVLFDVSHDPERFLFSQIPHGAIVEIVRPNWDLRDKIGTQLHVSHVGFALRNNHGDLLFRHASSDAKEVVEVLLVDYLKKYIDSETIKGINLQTVYAG